MKYPFEKNNTQNLFWNFFKNGELNSKNHFKLLRTLQEDNHLPYEPRAYVSLDLFFKTPRDRLARVMQKRKSQRQFTNKPLSEKQLASLFFAFSKKRKEEGFLIASAGAKYPVEVFAFLLNVKGKLNQSIVYYNAVKNALSKISLCPPWQEIQKHFGVLEEELLHPAVFFIFVLFPERSLKKYGERGGRFALMEVGQYAQNLSLRLVQEKLGGVQWGGLQEEEILKLLQISQNEQAAVCLGYACGEMPS